MTKIINYYKIFEREDFAQLFNNDNIEEENKPKTRKEQSRHCWSDKIKVDKYKWS